MRSQLRSIIQTATHSVTVHTKRSIAFTKLSTVSIGLIAAPLVPMIAFPGIAHADVTCDTGNALAGSSWLNGSGVNVCSHPGDGSNVYVNNTNGQSTLTGTKWQCVEMVNRLYLIKGWTTANWYGNGGGSNGLIYHVPSGLTAQFNGSISYINTGDVITLNYGTDGHAGIINSISGTTYNIINQNADLNSSAYISAGSLSGGNATLSMNAWAGYTVQGVVHHQTAGSGSQAITPASVSFNGNLNVFTVGSDDQVYQTYWNGSNWSGFAGLGGTFVSNPAVIVNGSALNVFVRGLDNQIYTEYNSGSGWSGWASLGSHQMKGNPTVMHYGSEMDVFALDTNNVPYKATWTSTNGWGSGWSSLSNYMASDLSAAQYGSNLYVIARRRQCPIQRRMERHQLERLGLTRRQCYR